MDKRFNNLFLTEKGREKLPEIRKILYSTRQILQKGMSPEEINQSLTMLNLMLDNIMGEVEKIRNTNDK